MNQNQKDQSVEKKVMTDNIILESVKLGSKFGLILSAIYATAGILLFFVIEKINEISLRALPLIIAIMIYIYFVAIMLSVIIGSLTGIIIGGIAKSNFARKIPKITFVFMSIIVCSLIALFIHVLFGVKIDPSFEPIENYSSLGIFETYPFLFGIPTIIYILAGGWFGRKMHSKFTTS